MFYLSLIIITGLSWLLTHAVRKYALTRNLMDNPNHRSSHTMPTPRGGGLAFVVMFLITVLCAVYYHLIPATQSYILMATGLFLAGLGFLDDYGHIDTRWRLCGHFAACAVMIWGVGGMPAITVLNWVIPSSWISNALGVIYLVWLLNLYNFMDGIDGIAGIEAVSVCIGAALIYGLTNALPLIVLPLFLASAVLGFLFLNFPPARIFMGDVGSSFLGFILGVFSIQAAYVNQNYFWVWLILLGVFIVDATFTLIRRMMNGVKVYEAHRSHAYQHAAQLFGEHLPVTLTVLVINSLWLFPIALCVGLHQLNPVIGLVIAYLPLILIAARFRAGKP